MPQRKSKPEPPVMTWTKASPALAIAVIFDLVRLFFEFFWFLGPALAGVYCAAKVGNVWVVGKLLTAACAAGAVAVGAGGIELTATFGTVMAMATGFAGWLAVGGWLMVTNSRIFKENALWFAGSLLISEVPLVGSLPAISVAVWKMHSNQIKIETAAHEKWEEENAEALRQEQAQQAAAIMQLQNVQLEQMAEQEAANEAVYEQAANDEIPEEERRAA